MATRRIDINVAANVGNVPTAMNQVGQSINNATASVKNFGPPIQNVQKQFVATVSNTKMATGALNQFGNSVQQNTGKLQGFGKMFSDNRGIVFGVAGLTSALGEAVGMMGMYGDTAQRLGEAQNKLNTLIDKGVTSGQAYAQAQNEVTKQQRFFNMVQRNTILSQMDMIFFSTMVISGLVKLSTAARTSGGFISKLSGVFKVAKIEAVSMDGALLNNGIAMNKANVAAQGLGKSIGFLGISLKGMLIGTGIGIAAVAIGFLVQKFMEWQEAAKKTAEEHARAAENIKNDSLVWSRITHQTAEDFLTDWEGMSDGVKEHAELIAQSIIELAKAESESHIRAARDRAVEMAQREIDHKAKLEQDLREIESERQKKLAMDQINGRPGLKKAYEMRTAGEQAIQKEIDNTNGRIKEYTANAVELNNKLNGLVSGQTNFANANQRITDALKVNESEAKTATATFQDMFNQFVQGGNRMKTAQEIMDAVNVVLKEAVVNGELTAGAAKLIGQAWETALGLGEKGAAKTSKEMKDMGTIVTEVMDDMLKLDDAMMKTAIAGETSNFWNEFNIGANDSVAVLKAADDAVSRFFAQWKKSIEAGMNPQEKFNELIANLSPQLQAILQIAYDRYVKRTADETKAATKEENKHTQEIIKKKEALMDSIEVLSKVGIAATMNERTNKLLKASYDDLVGSILEEGDRLLANQKIIQSLDTEHMKEIKIAEALMQTEAERIKILEDGFEGDRARVAAIREGTQAFSDDVGAIEKNNISLTENRNHWVELVQKLFPFIDTTNLLTSELQDLATEGLDTTTDSVIKLARAVDENANKAFQDLSAVFTAGNNKDFKKAWKDLDLGSIPDKFKDDFKRMSKEMRGFSEKGLEVKTGLDLVNTALSQAGQMTHEVSFKEIHETMKEVIKDFGDFARLDPESWELFHTFPKLFDDLQKHTEKFPLTMALFNEAIREGGFNANTSSKFLQAYVLEGGKLEDISEKDREKLELLGIQFDENGKPITDATTDTEEFTKAMNKLGTEAIVVQTIADMWLLLTNTIAEANDLLVEDWANTGVEILQKTAITDQAVFDMWALTVETMSEASLELAKHWSTMCTSMMKNASAAGNGIIKNLKSGMDKSAANMLKLAQHWSKMCNSMIANAKSAATGVNKELAKIKDKVVTITYKKVGSPQHDGGLYPMAEGGYISAAGGMNVSNGPTRSGSFVYGDNSGGREIQAFIPLDGHKADHIMDMINAQLGRREGGNLLVAGGGDREIIVPIVININGEQYSFTRKYRLRQGSEMAQQVF